MDENEVKAMLTANLQPIWEEQFEQSARLSTMRLLLEDLYADAYTNRSAAFTARMAQLLELTRSASVKGAPATDDAVLEMQVRAATHLERFRAATVPRIEARSGN